MRFGARCAVRLQDFALQREGDHLPGDVLAACLEGLVCELLEPAAPGHLHTAHLDACNIVVADDFGQLLRVVDAVELRTADEHHAIADEIAMEACIRKRRAVGGDEQVRTVEVRRMRGCELDLHGPVAQLGRSRCDSRSFRFPALARLEMRGDRILVVACGFALDNGDGIGGAARNRPVSPPPRSGCRSAWASAGRSAPRGC